MFLSIIAKTLGLSRMKMAPDRPKYLASSVLPGLTFDRRSDDYVTRAVWNGAEVEVRLAGVPDEGMPRILEVAHALWRDQKAWSQAIGERAVQDLLALKNEGWEEDDTPAEPLTPERFVSRMRLGTVAVNADEGFTFFFDDDGMFFGHYILVRGNLAAGVEAAEMHG